jgi:hypothetical protein
MKQMALRFFASCIGIATGIYFRDFWRSDFGPPTLIFLASICVTAIVSWYGRGKPLFFLDGVVFGLATAVILAITLWVNLYAGAATLIALLVWGWKLDFFRRWARRAELFQDRPDGTT